MAETFENVIAFTGIEQQVFIRQNSKELIEYILANKAEVGSSVQKALTALIVINYVYDKAFTANFNTIIEILLAVTNKETYNEISEVVDQFLKKTFSLFSANMKYEEGLQFLCTLNDSIGSSLFLPFKAYLMYFAYHTKNYSYVTEMLNSIISYVDLEKLIDNVNHAMYYYYKALIHLRLMDYEKAYIAFCVCIQSYVLKKGMLVTTLQLEAIKHIIIMSFIPSLEKYKSLNDFLFSKLKRLENLKEMEPFCDLYFKKGADFDMWIIKNKLALKQAKLLGLTKIVYKEHEKNKLIIVLRKYKRIHVQTLTQILDLSEEALLLYLRNLTQKNEVNIQYDEVENIIEVFPVDYCNENMFDKLKTNYECLANESNDMANAIKLIKEIYLGKAKKRNEQAQLRAQAQAQYENQRQEHMQSSHHMMPGMGGMGMGGMGGMGMGGMGGMRGMGRDPFP